MKIHLFASTILLGLCASANAELFVAVLDGLQENPAVATPGTGTGTANYNPITQILAIDISYSGLVAPTIDAHLHCCSTSLGTNAGVAIGFTGAGGFVLGSTSGNYSHSFDLSLASTYNPPFLTASGGTAALARDRLLNAMRVGVSNDPLPGDSNIAYFNLHTSFRPGGEIRGNLLPGIPEPSTVLLLTMGLATVACRRR